MKSRRIGPRLYAVASSRGAPSWKQGRTANQIRNQRKPVLACVKCFTWHDSGVTVCRSCRAMTEFHRFDSRIEALYAGQLRLQQRAGVIDGLLFHPKYTAKVVSLGGQDSWISWTPDGTYRRRHDDVTVVYDVKAKDAPLDQIFRLKHRIFSQILAAQVVVVRR